MSGKRRSGDSGNVMMAVWLIGIGILWLTDLWWPGILVLIGVSMLVRGMVPAAPREVAARPAERMEQAALDGREHEDAEGDEWEDDVAETPAFMVDDSEKKARHRSDLLPTECPACGAGG